MVRMASLNFRVSNDILRVGDPAPNQVKTLRIRVRDAYGRTRPNNIVKAKPLRCDLDGRILQIAPDRDLVVIGPAASTAMTSNARRLLLALARLPAYQ